MSLLRSEPPEAVRSLDELFAIAHGMEQEAGRVYSELAERVRAEGNPELAKLFDWLSKAELAHMGEVDRWSLRQRGKTPDPRDIRWDQPQTFADETANDLGPSRLASAYRVLSMAVRNEERAFAFWTYIASRAETEDVRRMAERMAQEELEHVAILRRERRRAYHAERTGGMAAPVHGSAELLAEAGLRERQLADRLQTMAVELDGEACERSLDLATKAAQISDRIASRTPAGAPAPSMTPAPSEPLAIAERLVEIYLEIGERAGQEDLVSEAQELAERAILRLAWLRVLAG